MTPTNQLTSMGTGQPLAGQVTDSNGLSFFGGQNQPQQASQSASRQLISEIAPLVSSLKSLAKSHPEMSESVDKAIELLKQGMTKTISGM